MSINRFAFAAFSAFAIVAGAAGAAQATPAVVIEDTTPTTPADPSTGTGSARMLPTLLQALVSGSSQAGTPSTPTTDG